MTPSSARDPATGLAPTLVLSKQPAIAGRTGSHAVPILGEPGNVATACNCAAATGLLDAHGRRHRHALTRPRGPAREAPARSDARSRPSSEGPRCARSHGPDRG